MCLSKQAGHDFLLPFRFGFIHPGSIIFSLSPKSIPKVWLYVPCFPPLKLVNRKHSLTKIKADDCSICIPSAKNRSDTISILHSRAQAHEMSMMCVWRLAKGRPACSRLPLLWLTHLSAQIKAKCRFVRVSHEWTLHNQKYQPLFNVLKLLQADQERAEIASY